jgi:hypothetical protein
LIDHGCDQEVIADSSMLEFGKHPVLDLINAEQVATITCFEPTDAMESSVLSADSWAGVWLRGRAWAYFDTFSSLARIIHDDHSALR